MIPTEQKNHCNAKDGVRENSLSVLLIPQDRYETKEMDVMQSVQEFPEEQHEIEYHLLTQSVTVIPRDLHVTGGQYSQR